MKCGIVVFPGSNCDHDVYHVLKHVLGCETAFLWHEATEVGDADLVVVPGGFSYGDYLRAGALAAQSPILGSVKSFAERGGPVLGICNGFQILQECGLLPGAMRRNKTLRFECRDVYLRVDRHDLPFTCRYDLGAVLRIPIAHAEGNYEDTPDGLERVEGSKQVVFRYVSPAGDLDQVWNVNGSANAIAGVVNEAGNVLGMMPHPERCAEEVLGNQGGLALFQGLMEGAAEGAA
ncbi:MAG: phosphoribosylformylglycinamidine synthase subunit PurQ [bacterium]|nr:phosphoribosylformylglycinamidine synthase subunit PurQ [bacterium]